MKRVLVVLAVALATMSCDSRVRQAERTAALKQRELIKEQAEKASKSYALEILAEYGTVIISGDQLNYNTPGAGLVSEELTALGVLSAEMTVVFINVSQE